MEDLEFYKYQKAVYQEDVRIQKEKRREALEKKYLKKSYVGTSKMVESAYQTDREQLNKDIEELNDRDAAKLEELHFGGEGLQGLKQQVMDKSRIESLRDKWIDKTKSQDNKPDTPEVFVNTIQKQEEKESKPEKPISVQFKESNREFDKG